MKSEVNQWPLKVYYDDLGSPKICLMGGSCHTSLIENIFQNKSKFNFIICKVPENLIISKFIILEYFYQIRGGSHWSVICAEWIFMQVAWMGLSTGNNVVKLLCNPPQWWSLPKEHIWHHSWAMAAPMGKTNILIFDFVQSDQYERSFPLILSTYTVESPMLYTRHLSQQDTSQGYQTWSFPFNLTPLIRMPLYWGASTN
jgi:hypothetical protein